MGMDCEINAIVRKKNNPKENVRIELAYWRKTYSLRDELVEIASNSPYLISTEAGDVVFNCRPQILIDIITRFAAGLTDDNDYLWKDSIWSPAQTKDITIENMRKLCAFNSYLNNNVDDDERSYLLGITDEEEIALDEWRRDPFSYELIIEIVNSY